MILTKGKVKDNEHIKVRWLAQEWSRYRYNLR